jgi:antitoxin MazE
MQSSIRNIGNSKGVILPANDQKRKGWAEAFQAMAENGDDNLLIPDLFEDENLDDCTWK